MVESTAPNTPVMRQYQEFRRRFPDHLLLFRLGEFFELFGDQAETAARELQITLTARQGVPMAGIPAHAIDTYVARLVRAGHRVALCDQIEAPAPGRKLLRREVVRVVTPGTLTEPGALLRTASNYLLAIVVRRGGVGVALLDVAGGELAVGQDLPGRHEALEAALGRAPSEVVLAAALHGGELARRLEAAGATLTYWAGAALDARERSRCLAETLGDAVQQGLTIEHPEETLEAAAVALSYVQVTQGAWPRHVARVGHVLAREAMTLDRTALETLGLGPSPSAAGNGSLAAAIDQTNTPMGGRRLRQWLERPLADVRRIAERQDAVQELIDAPDGRERLRAALGRVGDLERLTARAALGLATPRDLVGLRTCLAALPDVSAAGAACRTPLLTAMVAAIRPLERLRALLAEALVDEPPASVQDGGFLRETWRAELGAMAADARDGRRWLAELEQRERERTGLTSLRVRFNRVFGYGIEVSRSQADRVPTSWVRRQTLTGAERYVTDELRQWEARILGADERRRHLELELLAELRREVAGHARELAATAEGVACVDVLASFAESGAAGLCRPRVDEGTELRIMDGRHPVLAAIGRAALTPNDVELDGERRIVVLTGPNMAGKSVYLRQIGQLVVLAQAGAFVPAREAHIGVVDRIFTRVGAQDSLLDGRSTFLVEMLETASMLRSAGPRSLVLLDEVGRGTSTVDGLAIATAVVEHLHDTLAGAKTVFATHFHELTELARRLPGVVNFHMAVREWGDRIVFLYRVVPGGTDRSYGIQVARLAGVPAGVLERARAIASALERARPAPPVSDPQPGLFERPRDWLAGEVAALDLDHVTPVEALTALARWQERLRA